MNSHIIIPTHIVKSNKSGIQINIIGIINEPHII
jgi:hypothetical protein